MEHFKYLRINYHHPNRLHLVVILAITTIDRATVLTILVNKWEINILHLLQIMAIWISNLTIHSSLQVAFSLQAVFSPIIIANRKVIRCSSSSRFKSRIINSNSRISFRLSGRWLLADVMKKKPFLRNLDKPKVNNRVTIQESLMMKKKFRSFLLLQKLNKKNVNGHFKRQEKKRLSRSFKRLLHQSVPRLQ